MPNRAQMLVWEAPDDPEVRTELIDAALAVADEEGLEAVSVRRVGERVGRRPMSLYTHIPSKDGLVALMFDRISADLLVPDPLPADGRWLLRAIATRAFETYLAHPWMLHAFGRRPAPGPNQLRRAEQLEAAAAAMGIAETDAWRAVTVVQEWTMGHALHVVTLREDEPLARALQDTDAARRPAAFQESLAMILDAIQARYGHINEA